MVAQRILYQAEARIFFHDELSTKLRLDAFIGANCIPQQIEEN
jgi:hypothetical protein